MLNVFFPLYVFWLFKAVAHYWSNLVVKIVLVEIPEFNRVGLSFHLVNLFDLLADRLVEDHRGLRVKVLILFHHLWNSFLLQFVIDVISFHHDTHQVLFLLQFIHVEMLFEAVWVWSDAVIWRRFILGQSRRIRYVINRNRVQPYWTNIAQRVC